MELNFSMTTIPTIALWGIGFFVFAFGAFLGYVNMNVDARKKIDNIETKAEIIRTEAERKLADAEQKLEEVQLLRAQTPGLVDSESLLRLKKEKNSVLVEMDGKVLEGTLSVGDKKRLLELITHLRPFIESGASVQQSIPATSDMKTQPPPPSFTSSYPAKSEVKPVSILSTGQPKKKLSPEEEFSLLSIVKQIDTVLQKKLENSTFKDAGIHLQESPSGSVEVHIGLQKFESIDSVPDDKIRSMIREAIEEWESKYIPGL